MEYISECFVVSTGAELISGIDTKSFNCITIKKRFTGSVTIAADIEMVWIINVVGGHTGSTP